MHGNLGILSKKAFRAKSIIAKNKELISKKRFIQSIDAKSSESSDDPFASSDEDSKSDSHEEYDSSQSGSVSKQSSPQEFTDEEEIKCPLSDTSDEKVTWTLAGAQEQYQYKMIWPKSVNNQDKRINAVRVELFTLAITD